jgi:hypothetical protein
MSTNLQEYQSVLKDQEPRPPEPAEAVLKALGVLIASTPLFCCAGVLLASMGLHF